MTISAAIKSAMAMSIGLTSDDLEKACLDYDLDYNSEYSAEQSNKVNAVAASLLSGLLMLKSLSEGGFSVSFDVDEAKTRIKFLAANSGGLFVLPPELGLRNKVRSLNIH